MISRARLQFLSRKRGFPLGLIELDYVNSWVLYAIYSGELRDKLVFKGGTALSKLYFKETWRFSEDLDFTAIGEIDRKLFEEALKDTSALSGVSFAITSFHENPGFIRIRIQFQSGLGHKNSTRVEISLKEPLVFPVNELEHEYEDIPQFSIRVYSIEEIFVEKLRSLFQRSRARDYYDLFYLLEHHSFDEKRILKHLKKKCLAKDVALDLESFPDQEKIQEIHSYWNTSLDRLTKTKPAFEDAVRRIESYIRRLEDVEEA